MFDTGDAVIIKQEMENAARLYLQSADRLERMQGESDWRNAINGQREMAAICQEIADKAYRMLPWSEKDIMAEEIGA